MIKIILAALLSVAVALGPGVAAARGGGGHSGGYSSSHSSSHSYSASHHASGGSHSSTRAAPSTHATREKPVSVEGHYRKDGTYVRPFVRREPGTAPKKEHVSSAIHRSTKATGAQRDSHGHIKRSASAKADFKRSHPCPSTGKGSGACPGYVIDHVKALKHGGSDDPSNMQWQTTAEGKAKDKWE